MTPQDVFLYTLIQPCLPRVLFLDRASRPMDQHCIDAIRVILGFDTLYAQ